MRYKEILEEYRVTGNKDEFLNKVAAYTGQIIKTKLQEDSIAEKCLLTHYNLTSASENVVLTEKGDNIRYRGRVQPDGMAMQYSWRGSQKPVYVTGNHYFIDHEKMVTPKRKITEEQLDVDGLLKDQMEQQDFEEMRRLQDIGFLDALWTAAKMTGKIYAGSDKKGIDFTNEGLDKSALILGAQGITTNELKPQKMIISDTFLYEILAMDNTAIGNLSGELLEEGAKRLSKILGLEVIVSYKSKLRQEKGQWDGGSGDPYYNYHQVNGVDYRHYFDYEYVDTNNYRNYIAYYLTAPEYLGDFCTFYNDGYYAKWEGDEMEWYRWRKFGLGIANIYGVSIALFRKQIS